MWEKSRNQARKQFRLHFSMYKQKSKTKNSYSAIHSAATATNTDQTAFRHKTHKLSPNKKSPNPTSQALKVERSTRNIMAPPYSVNTPNLWYLLAKKAFHNREKPFPYAEKAFLHREKAFPHAEKAFPQREKKEACPVTRFIKKKHINSGTLTISSITPTT